MKKVTTELLKVWYIEKKKNAVKSNEWNMKIKIEKWDKKKNKWKVKSKK